MKFSLRKEIIYSIFYDPRDDFRITRSHCEMRYDPLTGQLSRILPSKSLKLPIHDWTPYINGLAVSDCPFCPENMEKATPRFPEEFIPGGRLKAGRAVVVPNISAYDWYNGVVIMTPEHRVGMGDITSGMVEQSLCAAMEFLRSAAGNDPDNARYGSVDWNYMPFAGGSVLHPHLQVIAGNRPSTYVELMIRGGGEYYRDNGTVFWADLLSAEAGGERRLGQTGNITWLATFAPRGLADVTAVIPGKVTAMDIDQPDIRNIASGVLKVIHYYHSVNIASFNMALYLADEKDEGFWASLRMVGRFSVYPLMVSDVSYMQALLGDSWTFHLPEEMALDLKKFF